MVEQLIYSPTRSRKFRQWSKPIPIHMENGLSEDLQTFRSEVLVHKLVQNQYEVPQPDESHKKLFIDNEHKEEELQKAIRKEAKISIPEVEAISDEKYSQLYPVVYHGPSELVDGVPNFSPFMDEIKIRSYRFLEDDDVEDEVEDYDLDSEDEKWIEDNRDVEIGAFEFESVMAQLNQLKISHPQESELDSIRPKVKLSRDVDLHKIFDYWVAKRSRSPHGCLKAPKIRVGTSPPHKWKPEDAYVAFHTKFTEQVRRRSTVEADKASYLHIFEITRKITDYLKAHRTVLQDQIERGLKKRRQILRKIEILEKNHENFEFEDMPLLDLEQGIDFDLHGESRSSTEREDDDLDLGPPTLIAEVDPYPSDNRILQRRRMSMDKPPLLKPVREIIPLKLLRSEAISKLSRNLQLSTSTRVTIVNDAIEEATTDKEVALVHFSHETTSGKLLEEIELNGSEGGEAVLEVPKRFNFLRMYEDAVLGSPQKMRKID